MLIKMKFGNEVTGEANNLNFFFALYRSGILLDKKDSKVWVSVAEHGGR